MKSVWREFICSALKASRSAVEVSICGYHLDQWLSENVPHESICLHTREWRLCGVLHRVRVRVSDAVHCTLFEKKHPKIRLLFDNSAMLRTMTQWYKFHIMSLLLYYFYLNVMFMALVGIIMFMFWKLYKMWWSKLKEPVFYNMKYKRI